MEYAEIDPVLNTWAQKKGLQIATKHRDDEVRSLNVVNAKGEKFQLWVEEIINSPICKIHVWDYKNKIKSIESEFNKLTESLDLAYSVLKKWSENISDSNNMKM